jgi:hypothetical protein
MSVRTHRSKRKGGYRVPRKRSEKALHRFRLKKKIFKKRGWKIKNFPDLFKAIQEYPYIVRRDDTRYIDK